MTLVGRLCRWISGLFHRHDWTPVGSYSVHSAGVVGKRACRVCGREELKIMVAGNEARWMLTK